MSDWWTHALCDGCWTDELGPATPVRLREPEFEVCCRCGEWTTSGIYRRAQPGTYRCCVHPEVPVLQE